MYTMRRVDLAQILRDAARTMAHPLAEQGFTLTLRGTTPDSSVCVVADADAIAQAVLNLIVNAMKYSGDARTIALGLDVSDREATITVTDQGIGIPPDEHERIFERFYRVASRDETSQPGAGLGLTIVRHAVLAHGGRIGVNSAPGKGSAFAIHLPLADTSPSATAARTHHEVMSG
jgi:two-component system sensor histidine kinase SenX3